MEYVIYFFYMVVAVLSFGVGIYGLMLAFKSKDIMISMMALAPLFFSIISTDWFFTTYL